MHSLEKNYVYIADYAMNPNALNPNALLIVSDFACESTTNFPHRIHLPTHHHFNDNRTCASPVVSCRTDNSNDNATCAVVLDINLGDVDN